MLELSYKDKLKGNIIPTRITPALARIVAHICADGYLAVGRKRRCESDLRTHPRRNPIRTIHSIRYTNTEPVLVRQFIDDVKSEFKRKVVKLKKHDYEVQAKWIHALVKSLGAGKSKEWFVSELILKSPTNVKRAWLQAFFDDEAYVEVPKKRIVLNMVNKKGLCQVKKLLAEFGIHSRIKGPYQYRQYYSFHLSILRDSLAKYSEHISFSHPKKLNSLKEMMGPSRFERESVGIA